MLDIGAMITQHVVDAGECLGNVAAVLPVRNPQPLAGVQVQESEFARRQRCEGTLPCNTGCQGAGCKAQKTAAAALGNASTIRGVYGHGLSCKGACTPYALQSGT